MSIKKGLQKHRPYQPFRVHQGLLGQQRQKFLARNDRLVKGVQFMEYSDVI